MTRSTVERIVALGALTGMRSMAGLTTLAAAHRGVARPLMAVAAVGEMVADKTTMIGDRTDPLPLAGRAIMGSIAGALVARERGHHMLAGGLLGATAAVVATHLAYHLRTRLPLSGTAAGLVEDCLVVGIASRYV